MNYLQTIEYIFNRTNFEQQGKFSEPLKLDKVVLAAAEIENPHQNFRAIHVAGTNGKGSVTHCLSAVLQTAGYKVGLFTSPHLIDFCERIKINGQPCSKDFVTQFVVHYKTVIEKYKLSFFEITTLMAFTHFSDEKIDIAIIETGLGGRLDATNIITPIISVITNIGLEHTEILGNTVEQIATEKGGIIKPKIPIIYGGNDSRVKTVLQKIANEKQSTFIQSQEIVKLQLIETFPFLKFKITNPIFDISDISTDLQGIYQIENIAVTLVVSHILIKNSFPITSENLLFGLRHVTTLTNFYGRWQTVSKNPLVIIDVAHNADGIAAVKPALQQLAEKQLTIVFGVVKDKNIDAMLQQLPSHCYLIITEIKSQRSAKKNDISPLIAIHHFKSIHFVTSITQVFEEFSLMTKKENVVVIIGSNYLAGEALQYFQKSNFLPF